MSSKARIPKETKTFKEEGTFESFYAAENWLNKNGYSYGSMCYPQPIAVVKGEYNLPEKWKNFSAAQKSLVDGIITSDDFREGEVTVILYN